MDCESIHGRPIYVGAHNPTCRLTSSDAAENPVRILGGASLILARLPDDDVPDVHRLVLCRADPGGPTDLDLPPPQRAHVLILQVEHQLAVHPLLKHSIP